jgi:hypothetical protein
MNGFGTHRLWQAGDHWPWPDFVQDVDPAILRVPTRSVLDMPIRLAGGPLLVPDDLRHLMPIIETAVRMERFYSDYDEHNIFITVDTRPVLPGRTQRRPGAHLDEYLPNPSASDTVAHTYLVSNCLPTEFFPMHVTIDRTLNCEQLLESFDRQAETVSSITYPRCSLLRLSPFVLHRAAVNATDETIERTFVKLVFTKKMHCREGNTDNPLIERTWPLLPRNPATRNHPFEMM